MGVASARVSVDANQTPAAVRAAGWSILCRCGPGGGAMQEAVVEQQQALVAALRLALRSAIGPVELFETHVSWVLVAPPHAYKIKKALRFDFLDFSTLAARRHFCEEEVRLNRRLAPRLYEGAVAITGTVAAPVLGGAGQALEYAVGMRSFGQDALWSRRAAQGTLGAQEIDLLARKLAAFHAAAARAPADKGWGSPDALRTLAADNIALLEPLLAEPGQRACLAGLRAWQEDCLRRLRPVFEERLAAGWVRECHGDLHCGNILTLDGDVAAFDCIEFNDALRWIDVMQDLAFACMDLRREGLRGLAARLLNGYLELGGDYAGVALLRYYEAECAMVRAKVELVRAAQGGPADAAACRQHAGALLAAAAAASAPPPPVLVVMHGFAGSGKSTVARALVELLGAVQLRSDVERKRMHGIAPGGRPAGALDQGLYSRASTDAVYRRLGALSSGLLAAGMPVIIDACCLMQQERAAFAAIAAGQGVPALLVDVRAGEAAMRARIRKRQQLGHDPSDADERVLDLQQRVHQPLSEEELAHALVIDSEAPFDPGPVLRAAGRLRGASP